MKSAEDRKITTLGRAFQYQKKEIDRLEQENEELKLKVLNRDEQIARFYDRVTELEFLTRETL